MGKVKEHEFINDMIVYAVRYSINRRSYASNTTAKTLLTITNAGVLYPQTVKVLIKDITMALKEGSIPYEDQKGDWGLVLSALEHNGNKFIYNDGENDK